MKEKLQTFKKTGVVVFENLLDKNKSLKIFNKVLKNRNWSKKIFRTKKEVIKYPQYTKTNPGKGICNNAEEFNLDFIEKNKTIQTFLNKTLGDEYEIVLKKFVVAVPDAWVPNWLKEKVNKFLIANLGGYIKKKFRDVTYFRGIDYHQDIIDNPNAKPDMLTMYVYLNDVDKNMSPLNVIEKSHILGPTVFPHIIKDNINNEFLMYGKSRKTLRKFKKKQLISKSGSVYFWTCLNLHGTYPQFIDDKFRISLRYIVRKNPKNKKPNLLDLMFNKFKALKKTRIDSIYSKNSYKQIKFKKILK